LRPRRLRRLHDDRRRPHGLRCSTLAIEVQGKKIRTVDGLASANGQLHPVQQAFCDKDALMCGFCTPGFVMASVGLLEKNPNPTPEQIKKGLDGNICRCRDVQRACSKRCRA
jgi:aerobic-type carbon monoxide dehydrogenase small subunit (CoxS/CutS family)